MEMCRRYQYEWSSELNAATRLQQALLYALRKQLLIRDCADHCLLITDCE